MGFETRLGVPVGPMPETAHTERGISRFDVFLEVALRVGLRHLHDIDWPTLPAWGTLTPTHPSTDPRLENVV